MKRSKPVMVFDGECDFCVRWIGYWKSITGKQVDYAPYQEVAHEFPTVRTDQFKSSVQLIDPDGTVYWGAQAVFRTLATRPGFRWLLWSYKKIPGVAPISESSYRFVARHRVGFSRITSILFRG